VIPHDSASLRVVSLDENASHAKATRRAAAPVAGLQTVTTAGFPHCSRARRANRVAASRRVSAGDGRAPFDDDGVAGRAAGGTDHPSNLQALCAGCNLRKGAGLDPAPLEE
jgi:hypothetical protein